MSQPALPLLLEPTTAYIVAYQSITTGIGIDMWIYQSQLNMFRIASGRQIAIYRNAADAFRPGHTSPGVVEGRIGNIKLYNNGWVAFQINDVITNTPTLLCIPCDVTNPTLYDRTLYRLANCWQPNHRNHILSLPTLPLPSRAEQSQQSTLSFYCRNEEEDGEWEDRMSEILNVAEFDPVQQMENSRPSPSLIPNMIDPAV
jgi:hypothetical protein